MHGLVCLCGSRTLDLLSNSFSGDGSLKFVDSRTILLQPQVKELWRAAGWAVIDKSLSDAARHNQSKGGNWKSEAISKKTAEMAVFAAAVRAASPQSWAVLAHFWWTQASVAPFAHALLKTGNPDSLEKSAWMWGTLINLIQALRTLVWWPVLLGGGVGAK